jgi:hypothetical protein
VVAFLLAAKAHGRQLRLEREKEGILSVTFGGKNPPFVEALWARERWLFWGCTVLLALGAAVLLWRTELQPNAFAVLALCPTAAFCVTGFLSFFRQGAPMSSLPWWGVALAATLSAGALAVR